MGNFAGRQWAPNFQFVPVYRSGACKPGHVGDRCVGDIILCMGGRGDRGF